MPQNFYESWAVATRPIAANGLGLSDPRVQIQVGRIKRLFRFLPDHPTLFAEWEAWSEPRVSRPHGIRRPARRRHADLQHYPAPRGPTSPGFLTTTPTTPRNTKRSRAS